MNLKLIAVLALASVLVACGGGGDGGSGDGSGLGSSGTPADTNGAAKSLLALLSAPSLNRSDMEYEIVSVAERVHRTGGSESCGDNGAGTLSVTRHDNGAVASFEKMTLLATNCLDDRGNTQMGGSLTFTQNRAAAPGEVAFEVLYGSSGMGGTPTFTLGYPDEDFTDFFEYQNQGSMVWTNLDDINESEDFDLVWKNDVESGSQFVAGHSVGTFVGPSSLGSQGSIYSHDVVMNLTSGGGCLRTGEYRVVTTQDGLNGRATPEVWSVTGPYGSSTMTLHEDGTMSITSSQGTQRKDIFEWMATAAATCQ